MAEETQQQAAEGERLIVDVPGPGREPPPEPGLGTDEATTAPETAPDRAPVPALEDENLGPAYLDTRGGAAGSNAAEELLRRFGRRKEEAPAGPAPEAPAPDVEARPDERSFLEDVGAAASDIGRGLTIELPLRVMAGGVRDATQEALEAIDSLAVYLNENVADLTIMDPETAPRINLPEIAEPETVTGNLGRDVVQFLFGFKGAGLALKGLRTTTRAGRAAKAAGQGAAADAVVFDPREDRLSNLLDEYPELANPVTDFLAADETDTEAEGRLKNALEGLFLGTGIEGASVAVEGFARYLRALRKARRVKIERAKERPPVGSEAAEEGAEEAAQPRDFIVLGDPDGPLVEVAREAGTERIGTAADALRAGAGEPAEAGFAVNINLARLETTDDIRQAITDVGRLFADEIDTARRGVQSNELTQQLASEMGMTPEQLLRRRRGQAFNAEEALAARQILVSSGEQLIRLARKAQGVDASEADIFAFRKAMALHAAIQQQVSGLTAEAGRALQAFNIPAGGSAVQVRLIREMLDNAGGAEFSREMAQKLAALDGTDKINQAVRRGWMMKATDAFFEVWINALLSGPQTHVVNSLSNSLVALWQMPERLLAAGIGRLSGSDAIRGGEAVAQAFGMLYGFREGMSAAAKTLRTGEPIDELAKIESRRHRAISAEALEISGVPGRAVDFLGETIRLPGRFLMAEDEFFKGIGYRMEVWAQAYRTASEEGLTGKAFARRVHEITTNPPENIHMAAVDAARYQTFTNELGQAGKGYQRIMNQIPALRLITPFFRTPVNIIKFVGQRSPLAPIMQSFRQDIAAGGARRDLALARMSMGSMIMAAAADLTMQGHITGAGPADFRLRSTLRNTGWQPYSIKIGDTWYAYNRLDPIGATIGLAADVAEIMGQVHGEEREMLAAAAVMSVAQNITSKTYLQGMTDLFEVMSDPQRYGGQYVARFLGTVIPTGVAQIERVVDPTLRETRDTSPFRQIVNQIRSRVPGYSEDLPPRRNIWGEPIVLSGGLGPDIMSPIYASRETQSPVDEEIMRLRVPLSMPSRQISGVELLPEEYGRYVELAGNAFKNPQTGLGLKETLEQLLDDPNYQRQSDGPEGGKALIIRNLVLAFRQAAQAQLIEEFPALRLAIEEQTMERGRQLAPPASGQSGQSFGGVTVQ